jgi:autotransporter-associated beta strand protein
VTLPTTAGLVVGQSISNAFLPAGTYIRRITGGTTIGMSHINTGLVAQTSQAITFGAAAFTSDQTVSNVEVAAISSPVTVTPGGTSTLLTFVNVSGTGGVSKAGNGTLRFTGAVSYAGPSAISAGTLDFATSANITLTNAITGSGIFRQSGAGTTAVDAAANYINSFNGAVVVDGGTLRQGSGSVNQYRGFTSASSFTVNSGATLLTARDAMNGGAPLNLNGGTFRIAPGGGAQTLGPVTLNGGTMVTCQGMGDPWSAFMCNGDFTVTGSVPSVIRADPGLYNGVHLLFNTYVPGKLRAFRVEDVTGNADPDLTISANLLESSHSGTNAGLVKVGAGTLLLSGGTNIYSGATIVSNGTLLVSGGMSNSAVTVVSGAAFGTADTQTSKVAALTLAENSKVVWKYDGNAHTAGRIEVLGTLNLPSAATLDVSGTGYLYSGQTLFSAATVTGATSLSGWTVTGAPANSSVVRVGNTVALLVNRGTLIRVQ